MIERVRAVGWDKLEAASWPAISASLVRPWPEEACRHDLRWWESQVYEGTARRMPGHAYLEGRWGRTEHDVRTLLKSPTLWMDATTLERRAKREAEGRGPKRDAPSSPVTQSEEATPTADLPSSSRPSPADLPPTSRDDTEERQHSADILPFTSRPAPAVLPSSSRSDPSPSPPPPIPPPSPPTPEHGHAHAPAREREPLVLPDGRKVPGEIRELLGAKTLQALGEDGLKRLVAKVPGTRELLQVPAGQLRYRKLLGEERATLVEQDLLRQGIQPGLLAGALVIEDPNEGAWAAVLAAVRAGKRSARGLLTGHQMAALHAVGGCAAIVKANDFELDKLRVRFLLGCRPAQRAEG